MQNAEKKIDRLFRIVSNHASRLSGPNVDADDLTQITIEKALKSKALPIRPSINWLYAATRNAKNDILRKVYREREMRDSSVLLDAVRLGYHPEKNTSIPSVVFEPSDPYLLAAIELAMQKLCSSKKEAFLLYADGFSYEEIADLTKANLNTVRTRLHFAKRFLRNELASHC
jgi:RNA polymerase sigma-70 factor (ECF subfamily)